MADFFNNLSTALPAWQGVVWPSTQTGQVLVAGSAAGALLAEYTANLSAAAPLGDREGAYQTQMLCLDAMGELLFGVFSIV